MFTEEEAKAKWCPFARTVWDDGSTQSASWNRWVRDTESGEEGVTKCIASACMAWRTGPPLAVAEINEAIEAGHVIDAIKMYRNAFGCTIKEAADKIREFRDSATRLHAEPLGYCGLAGKDTHDTRYPH